MTKIGQQQPTMPPSPTPIHCESPGCPYVTPDGLPSYDQVHEQLLLHCRLAHPVASPQNQQGQPAPSKPDRRQRPEARQDMSEHDFRFFESEWGLYKRATGVKNQALVDELWSCMSEPLKKLAFDQGDIASLSTEEAMMARIKSLAVAVLHTAIHTVRLHEAEQITR